MKLDINIGKYEKKTKYNNEKVIYNGICFASIDEKDYYLFLLDMQSKGILKIIELQPRVELLAKFEKHGKKYPAITYTPDFLVEYEDGRRAYLDYKGMETQQGNMRRKMFASVCDDELIWITKSKKYSKTGFVNYDELKRLRKANKK